MLSTAQCEPQLVAPDASASITASRCSGIPHGSLLLSLQRGSLLSEPAIQVRRKGKGKQIWSLEKLDNRLLDMRDLYQEWKECEEDTPVSSGGWGWGAATT